MHMRSPALLAFFLPFLSAKALDLHLGDALSQTWKGIKERNIWPFEVKLVHRPRSETPNDAVSEGVGYGMLVALYCNDQDTFNTLWGSAEHYMWNGLCYDWRVDEYGKRVAEGAATDAEQDIAVSLIFAQRLVDAGVWIPHNNPTYRERAQSIMDNMWDTHMITSNYNLAPGAGWGGDDFINPGYFAPAWYRIFQRADEHNRPWNLLIDRCYRTIAASPGFKNGLVPDWMSPDGDFVEGGLGYNTYGGGAYLYKDAIRVYWRLGTDYMWFNEPRAKPFLQNAYEFITSKGGPSACNFYTMNGSLLPATDMWEFNDGHTSRPRREHSPLTIGMWSTVAYSLQAPDREDYLKELMTFYEPNSTFWGTAESADQNEMYFEQFLAWFGAVIYSGTWLPIH